MSVNLLHAAKLLGSGETFAFVPKGASDAGGGVRGCCGAVKS